MTEIQDDEHKTENMNPGAGNRRQNLEIKEGESKKNTQGINSGGNQGKIGNWCAKVGMGEGSGATDRGKNTKQTKAHGKIYIYIIYK